MNGTVFETGKEQTRSFRSAKSKQVIVVRLKRGRIIKKHKTQVPIQSDRDFSIILIMDMLRFRLTLAAEVIK